MKVHPQTLVGNSLMQPATEPISASLKRIYKLIILWAEKFTAGRNWILKVFLLCVAFSILFSGGVDLGLVARGGYQEGYFLKIEHPLYDMTKIYGEKFHEANINFRLTVPLLLHLTGIHGYWSLPFLTVAAICSVLITSCVAAYRITGDRICALFIALNVAATYVGSFGFIWYYDAIAISQLALAALPGVPWWGRGILVFTASFTDERAWAASSLLLVGNFCFSGPGRSLFDRLRNPNFLAVAGGMLFYILGRLLLMKYAGLSSPTTGNGPGKLVNVNFHYLHAAIWFALEGGWLFYGLAVGVLFVRRQFWSFASLVLVSLCFLGFALMIGDVLRSTIYIFPLLFLSLSLVSQNETLPILRCYSLLAFLISAMGGNYNVYLDKITWFQPLVIHWMQTALNVLYEWVYPLLPHTHT